MTSAGTDRRQVVRDSLGVGIATGLYGTSFGAVAVASGLSVAQTCVLSLVMFTGASQFALVGVLAGGGTPLASAMTALLLGSRNTLYGLRVGPLLAWRGAKRLGAAHLLIDESTAMSITRPDRDLARVGFLATGLSIFVLWNGFTFVGAIAGEALGDPETYGLDAAVGAAFLASAVAAAVGPRQPGRGAGSRGARPGAGPGHRRRRTRARGRRRRAAGGTALAPRRPHRVPEARR